ncbi:MAG TPA: hypothetical protein EYP53_04145 [Candidatus Latescibacteria bacterium]|nr:hypothetical protein [Candidatus Latescibacterota bacterium]
MSEEGETMNKKETKIEHLFCTDEAHISKESVILSKEPKVIRVHGEEVKGWIIKIEVPATDGLVPLTYTRTEEVE